MIWCVRLSRGDGCCGLPGTKMPGPGDVIVEEVNVAAIPNLLMPVRAPARRRLVGER